MKGPIAAAVLLLGFILQASGASRHSDPALEAMLPQTLGGVALIIESQAGGELSTASQAFDAFLKTLGKSRADFSLASAYSQGEMKAAIGAWRVKGAVTADLLPGFIATLQASSTTTLAVAVETLAGREATRIGDPGQLAQGSLYVFAKGDTLFFVQTPERALAEEAMGKLPQ